MPNNYVLLETIALTQSAASVTFDNLPTSGYTDLKIVTSARGTVNLGSGYVDGILTFNGTTTGYSERMVYGLGGSAASVSQSSTGIKWGNWANDTSTTANTFGNSETYIPNYRSSNFKSVSVDGVQENNASGSAIAALNAGLWSNTAAITSITFTPGSGSFAAGSTFSLYGIAALGTTPLVAPKATGGNIVANDGTYWYHAFTSSGYFVPQVGLTADCLVVAGGGGANSGGGGAGGYRSATSMSLTLTNYAVIIGAGGAGTTGANNPSSGSNSIFDTITSAGGGASGGTDTGSGHGVAGGSGGGGAGEGARTTNGGAGNTPSTSPSQGNNAGGNAGYVASPYPGGGGGGAGAVGTSASSATASGNGGAGSNTHSSWATATNTGVSGYYAGGGGGGGFRPGFTPGTGGAGGGGAGQVTVNGTNGISNTGGGAGATNTQLYTGGAGGSGIVIIRYPIN